MSWSFNTLGRAGRLAQTVAETFAKTQGAQSGAETEAKNKAGEIAAAICAEMADPQTVMKIEASGSTWKEGDKARHHHFSLQISTIGDFVE